MAGRIINAIPTGKVGTNTDAAFAEARRGIRCERLDPRRGPRHDRRERTGALPAPGPHRAAHRASTFYPDSGSPSSSNDRGRCSEIAADAKNPKLFDVDCLLMLAVLRVLAAAGIARLALRRSRATGESSSVRSLQNTEARGRLDHPSHSHRRHDAAGIRPPALRSRVLSARGWSRVAERDHAPAIIDCVFLRSCRASCAVLTATLTTALWELNRPFLVRTLGRQRACGRRSVRTTRGARAVARLRRSFRVHEPAYAQSLGPAKLWRNNRFFVHSSNSKGGQVSPGAATCVHTPPYICTPGPPGPRDGILSDW